jgi:glycyl-tRNA synthetase
VDALYGKGGLPFWTEREIMIREQAITRIVGALSSALTGLNSAWSFHRVEGPLLTPRQYISSAYDDSDIFLLNAKLGEDQAALRAETTASSYLYLKALLDRGLVRYPVCVWQAGKSFRVEAMDGATASNLRYNEFYQLEFQCAYKANSKADYRAAVEPVIAEAIRKITGVRETRIIPSDRLPAYSEITNDVEVPYTHPGSTEKWKEMCSISTRTDFPVEDVRVLEVAVGLDRLVAVEGTL